MRSLVLAAIAAAALCAGVASPAAAAYTTHALVTGAEQWALESHGDQLADPQVFVHQDGAAAASGPQGIAHAAGLRPALMTDDPAMPAYNAQGKALGFSLGSWFGARATVVYDAAAVKPQVALAFAGLVPSGTYSLFARRGEGAGTFTPLDGSGAQATFSADPQGNAAVRLTAPEPFLSGSAIVLVYHSDGTAHGSDRGQPGVSAHQQLVYRVP